MQKINFGVIGCGKQAEKHIQSLQKFSDTAFTLSDVNPDLAKNLSQVHSVAWVEKAEDIFDSADIDAVLICTPTPFHAPLIEKSLSSGKFVFCEKPLCASYEEAVRIRNLENKTGIPVLVGYLYRFVPVFEKALNLMNDISQKEKPSVLGKPLSAFFRIGGRGSHQLWKHLKSQGGGAVNEMLVHMIDLANWYFGPLDGIEVVSKNLKSPLRVIHGKTEKVDAEDYIVVKTVGKMNTDVLIQADLITPIFNQYIEIQCENGSFMGSIVKDMPSYVFLKEGRAGYPSGKTLLDNGSQSFLDMQMAYFYYCVKEKRVPDRNRIEDSIALMRIIDSIRNQ